MTVAELITRLQQLPAESNIVVWCGECTAVDELLPRMVYVAPVFGEARVVVRIDTGARP